MSVIVKVEPLPEGALEALTQFQSKWIPEIRERLSDGQDVVIVLQLASTDHADWRRATARDLARAHAPARVNIISGDNQGRIDAAAAYLAEAPGVTGQYLPLHSD